MSRILATIALVALSTLAAQADESAFYGSWTIVSSSKAPWEDPAHPMVTNDDAVYIGKVVTIAPGRMDGPDMLGCGKTELSIEPLPYEALFEGGLATDPTNPAAPEDIEKAKRLAHEIGFATSPVDSLFHGCSELILHKVDARTLAFGLDNRIYRLEKK
jgi:hypothetical protein